MAAPLLLADNLGSITEYPAVVITDQSGTIGPAGFEAWRPFSSRRSAFSFWMPGSTNVDAFILIQCDQVRGANFLALDRGHNLKGFTVNLFGSQDGSTFQTVNTGTVPTVTGGQLGGANGVLTEEGAWILTFPTQGFTYWKIDVPAMGTGLQPNIVGAYLGGSYSPVALYRPFGRRPTELRAQEVVSPLGWRGRGPRAYNRNVTFNVRMNDPFEYVSARFTLEELYGAGKPMWVIEDQSRPTEAWLALRPLGTQGFSEPPNWSSPVGTFMATEHEPLPVT
jgi:hypothetical protein